MPEINILPAEFCIVFVNEVMLFCIYLKTMACLPITMNCERGVFDFTMKISDMITNQSAYFAVVNIFPYSFVNLIVGQNTVRVVKKVSQQFKSIFVNKISCSPQNTFCQPKLIL